MRIVIAGGSGFLGSALRKVLQAQGHQVTILSRRAGAGRITWKRLGEAGLPVCDALVNFAGAHIMQPGRRWTPAYRREIVESRLDSTRALVRAVNEAACKPRLFVSTVGKCYYGTSDPDRLRDERDASGQNFPALLCDAWEREARAVTREVRHVQMRIGIVLAETEETSLRLDFERGGFPIFRSLFERFGGFMFGDGTQLFPWVHVDDLVGAYLRCFADEEMCGVYNVVAPTRTPFGDFAEGLAARLGVRLRWSLPPRVVTALVGAERSSILLEGQSIHPRRLLERGYGFRHPTIAGALDDLLSPRSEPAAGTTLYRPSAPGAGSTMRS